MSPKLSTASKPPPARRARTEKLAALEKSYFTLLERVVGSEKGTKLKVAQRQSKK